MPAAAERMSRVDTAWLRMDNDVNLMMIVGVWLLDPAIRYEALAERINDKLLKYGRFRQKVVQDAMGASWVEDDAFEPANHVVKHTLRRRRGQSERAALQELAGELATTPLDPTRPLWQFHFIEHYEGGSALIARVHHCIADGIALISVMMSITDGGMDPPSRKPRKADDSEGDWLTDAVVKPLTDLTVKAIGMYGGGVAKSMEVLANPAQPLFGSMDMARSGYQVVSDVAAMAMMPDDSPTLLKGKPVGTKKVAWGDRQGAELLDQRRAAVVRRRSDRRLSARLGRRPAGQGDPRDGAGESAPARQGLPTRQPLRPRAAGAADRYREPDRARLRGARANE